MGASAGGVVRVLGAVVAERDGVSLDLGSRKQRAVLGLLIAARTHVVPVDRIIEELWQGEAPPTAMATLQAYVSRLRRVLEPEHGRRSSSVLVSSSPGYAVRLPVEQVDAWQFERLVGTAEGEGDAAARLGLLDEALGLWRGPAFAEFADDEWAVPEVARLTELRLHARELLIDAALRAGAYPRAVVEGEALVGEAPLREQGWRLLALAQYASARQGEALASLRRARETLAEELGLDPGPALQHLEQAILSHTVDIPTGSAPGPVATNRSLRVADAAVPAPDTAPRPPVLGSGLFVGREADAERLLDAAERARGRVGVGVVSGEPGAGKSCLLRHVVDELTARGWLVAVGRCPEVGGAPPAWAWSEVLRSLAAYAPVGAFADALAPFLRDDAPPRSGDADQARFRMHQAAADWLSSLTERPTAIVLDDVHRADAETQRLLTSVIEKVAGTRLFVLISHRTEHNDELTDLMADIAPWQPERVVIGGLDRTAAEQLVAEVSGTRPTAVVLGALLERTDGNPFYLKEFARLLASIGPRELLKTVPAGVADVMRHRLSRLPESAQSILRLAAAIGRTVDVDVLVAASRTSDDEVFDALEAGEIAGLLTEFGPATIRFDHVLVRDVLYGSIPASRLRSVHAAVAAAVEAVTPADVPALAHHLALSASPGTADKAVRYCLTAAGQAESRYAYDRAVELYRQGLACLDLTEPEPRRRLEILLRLISALVLSGDTTSFVDYRREAVALARQLGDSHMLARAISGWLVTPWWIRYGHLEVDFVAEATDSLADADLTDNERAQLLSAYLCEIDIDDDPAIERTVREVLTVARRTGDPEAICRAIFAASFAIFDHPADERYALRMELRQIADAHGLGRFQVLAGLYEALAALQRGDVHATRLALDESIPLARDLQLRWANLALTQAAGSLAAMTGDYDRAETLFRETVDVARQFDPESDIAEHTLAEALFALRYAQDRLGEIVPVVRAAYDLLPKLYSSSLVCCLVAAGDEAQARDIFAAGPVTPDHVQFWTSRWVIGARAALMLGDEARAALLYEKLLPHQHDIGGVPTGPPLEPIAHTLGALALRVKGTKQARQHLEEALDIATGCQNALWIGRITADLARTGG